MPRLAQVATSLTLGLILGAFGASPAQAQTAPPPAAAASAVPARPADVSSMDGILAALYDVISAGAGQKRDWDRLRSLFIPGARLIPTGGPAGQPVVARVWSVEDYIQRAGPGLEAQGFFEREIGRSVDSFGPMTQVFSSYETKRAPTDATPFQRGINSIQLLNDGTRWWVVTIYWAAERPGNPIPDRYLKK